jgi:ABC-type nitrate/sulfonate/bicarbonate transport system substrate-binding protein
MKSNNYILPPFVISLAVILSIILCCTGYYACNQKIKESQLDTLRLGYPISLSTHGQITATLKKTNILKANNLFVNFNGFTYGGPLTEAAMSNQLDVIFVGDQPAMNLIAKTGQWKIVARLIYTNVGIFAAPNSKVNSIADLKGLSIASPFNSVAHRDCIIEEEKTGLNPQTDFKNVNADILEIGNMVQSGNWSNVDAVAVWDPLTTLIRNKKLGKELISSPALVVIAVSNKFIDNHPKVVERFLASVSEAYYYFAKNIEIANQWYINTEKIRIPLNVLDDAMKIDPNIQAKSLNDIDLSLNKSDHQLLYDASNYAFANKFTIVKVNPATVIDTMLYKKAKEWVEKSKFDINQVKVN